MASNSFAAGSTSKRLYVRAIVASTGLPYTAGAYNTATLAATYTRNGATPVAITLANNTAGGSWASGGFVKTNSADGVYQFDPPNAALATPIVDDVVFAFSGIADVIFDTYTVYLTNGDPRAAGATDYATSTALATVATAVGDVPTNAELATALAAADDAVLTAVAGVSTLVQDVPTNAELATALTGMSTLNAAGVRTAVGLATANLDTQLDALPTNAELATALTGMSTLTAAGVRSAVGLATANLDTQLSAMANAARDAIFSRLIEPGLTFLGAMRVKSAMLFGKTVNGGTDTETYKSARNDGTAGKTRVVMEFLEADRVDVDLDVTDEV